jgi:hypothetical protein
VAFASANAETTAATTTMRTGIPILPALLH